MSTCGELFLCLTAGETPPPLPVNSQAPESIIPHCSISASANPSSGCTTPQPLLSFPACTPLPTLYRRTLLAICLAYLFSFLVFFIFLLVGGAEVGGCWGSNKAEQWGGVVAAPVGVSRPLTRKTSGGGDPPSPSAPSSISACSGLSEVGGRLTVKPQRSVFVLVSPFFSTRWPSFVNI